MTWLNYDTGLKLWEWNSVIFSRKFGPEDRILQAHDADGTMVGRNSDGKSVADGTTSLIIISTQKGHWEEDCCKAVEGRLGSRLIQGRPTNS